MKKQGQSQDQTARLIGEHTPPSATASLSADESTIVPIDISLIEPYQHNPRLYDNPKFETIKESIRERGVLQRLIVTKRPGSEKFTLCQGGNTRLRCLKELYKETSDPKFATAYCELRIWRDETDLMVGHVVENELRGNLNWHEKSRMVVTLYEMFSEQTDGKLPDIEFERIMQTKGVTVHRRLMTLHRYTVNNLEPYMPKQFQRGLSRRKVEGIMKIDQTQRSIWITSGEPEKNFDELFRAVLAEYDEKDFFNVMTFLSQIAKNASDVMLVSPAYLEHATDWHMRMGGDLPVFSEKQRLTPLPEPDTLDGDWGAAPPSAESEPSFQHNEPAAPVQSELTLHENVAPRHSHRRPKGQYDALDGERVTRLAPARTEKLRVAIYREANLFETATFNRGCIIKMDLGYGFIVLHPPQEADLSPTERFIRDQAWWLLHELSAVHEGLPAAPDLIKNFASAERSPFVKWFETAEPDELAELANLHGVSPSPLLHSVGDLLRTINDRQMKIVVNLIAAVRKLEQHYLLTQTSPWEIFAEQENRHQS